MTEQGAKVWWIGREGPQVGQIVMVDGQECEVRTAANDWRVYLADLRAA